MVPQTTPHVGLYSVGFDSPKNYPEYNRDVAKWMVDHGLVTGYPVDLTKAYDRQVFVDHCGMLTEEGLVVQVGTSRPWDTEVPGKRTVVRDAWTAAIKPAMGLGAAYVYVGHELHEGTTREERQILADLAEDVASQHSESPVFWASYAGATALNKFTTWSGRIRRDGVNYGSLAIAAEPLCVSVQFQLYPDISGFRAIQRLQADVERAQQLRSALTPASTAAATLNVYPTRTDALTIKDAVDLLANHTKYMKDPHSFMYVMLRLLLAGSASDEPEVKMYPMLPSHPKAGKHDPDTWPAVARMAEKLAGLHI